MPDGAIATLQTVKQESMSGDQIEVLALAYKEAEKALNDAGRRQWELIESIRARYPKPPRQVADFFLTHRQKYGIIEHPAPFQEEALVSNVEYWRGWGLKSDVCQYACQLLSQWRSWRETCEAIYAEQGGPPSEELEERLSQELEEADERFITARTTSLNGVLLKLERAAEVEDLAGKLEENPRLFEARIVLGLIRDLKQHLGRS